MREENASIQEDVVFLFFLLLTLNVVFPSLPLTFFVMFRLMRRIGWPIIWRPRGSSYRNSWFTIATSGSSRS